MRLACTHCRHIWTQECDEQQAVIVCPKCEKKVSLTMARQMAERLGGSKPSAPTASPTGTVVQPSPTTATDSGTVIGSSKLPESTPPTAAPNSEGPSGTMVNSGEAPTRQAEHGTMQQGKVGADQGVRLSQSTQKPADKSQPKSKRPKAHSMEHLIGKVIDGYRIEKLLGAGGMGAVFLAHQLSLDRKVAIKVLPTRFAKNADFLARFTREALSAAQINHHNLVGVYDVGSDDEVHYIAMEFVKGESLGQMIKRDGRLQPDVAAGFVLQTARGLHFAHECGIIHRDIKPDNLMINDSGIVKIADMGLAKMQGHEDPDLKDAARKLEPSPTPEKISSDTNLTQASVAMGTPAYMAPEQARDAGSVDARADQYSLGCTLYYLIAGTTPYHGTTAFELMSKHMNEAFTPLDVHVKGVPDVLKQVLTRMLEKDPGKRYPSLREAARDIEAFLGIDSEKGPFSPREQHLARLERAQKEYYAAPAIKQRRFATLGFFAVLGLAFLGSLFTAHFSFALSLLGLLILTPIASFIIDGLKTRNDLFRRVRSVFFGMPMGSWAKLVIGGLILFIALLYLHWLGLWIGYALVATGLASGYQVMIVQRLRTQRADAVGQMQELLKELRLRGLSEDDLQSFVCRFSGSQWEEFFEEFFGYESMLEARGRWGAADKVTKRRRHAIWREPITRWLENIEQARKAARERKQLAKVETERLKAQGVSEQEAERQGELEATRIVKDGLIKPAVPMEIETGRTRSAKRGSLGTMLALVRAVIGLVILACWVHLMGIFEIPVIGGLIEQLYAPLGAGGSIYAAVAGGALVLSLFLRGIFSSLIMLAGAAAVVGATVLAESLPVPGVGPGLLSMGGAVACVAGVVLAFLGRRS